jgi:hypothetical protein
MTPRRSYVHVSWIRSSSASSSGSAQFGDRAISFFAVFVIHVFLLACYALRGGTFARTVTAFVIGLMVAGFGTLIAGRDSDAFWRPSTARGWAGSIVQGVAPLQGLIFGARWLPPGRSGSSEGHPLETVGERIFYSISMTIVIAVIIAFEQRRERRHSSESR